MQKRKLRNLEVSAVGFGCMGFSHGYGPGLPSGAQFWLTLESTLCPVLEEIAGSKNGEGRNED